MDMKKIFASFLICGALSLGSVPAHADDGIVDTIFRDVDRLVENIANELDSLLP